MTEEKQMQIIQVHGPYEDAIIAGFTLAGKVIDGQDAATRKELWQRWLEVTKPLHELAVSGMAQIDKFFQGLVK